MIKVTTQLLLIGTLVIPVVSMAQGYDADAAMRQAQQLQKQYGEGQQSNAEELPEIIKLKESDITRFIKTMKELGQLGVKFDEKRAKQGPARTMAAIEADSKAMSILRKNKFTTDRLAQVVYSIAMAMAGLDMDEDAAGKARAQGAQALERMRGQLSAQQLAAIQQQMGTAMKSLDQFEDQPEGNLELVRKYRKALEAGFGSSRPRKIRSR